MRGSALTPVERERNALPETRLPRDAARGRRQARDQRASSARQTRRTRDELRPKRRSLATTRRDDDGPRIVPFPWTPRLPAVRSVRASRRAIEPFRSFATRPEELDGRPERARSGRGSCGRGQNGGSVWRRYPRCRNRNVSLLARGTREGRYDWTWLDFQRERRGACRFPGNVESKRGAFGGVTTGGARGRGGIGRNDQPDDGRNEHPADQAEPRARQTRFSPNRLRSAERAGRMYFLD